LRADLAQTVREYYARKAGFRGNQPRWPQGTPGDPKPGGRWSGGPGTGAPVDGGNPAGRNPGGHHFVPRVIFGKENLKPETRKVFEEGATGPLRGKTHRGGEGHDLYNRAVKEAFDRFKADNHIAGSEDMTPEQAKKFLDEVKRSSDPRIRNFNMRIYMREVQYYLRRIPRRMD
jgi:hypothetical protein